MSSPTGPAETISIIIPIHNEEANIDLLVKRLVDVFTAIPYKAEMLWIDDGSTDQSVNKLRAARRLDTRVKIIELTRNFGHQNAITAGIDHTQGEACVIMDGDLQDPPELIPQMIQKWKEGFDVVYSVRNKRIGESFFKRITAAGFYRVMHLISDIPFPSDAADFRLLDRKVILSLRQLKERSRYLRGLVNWLGYKQAPVYYSRPGRQSGESNFSIRRMVRFALDAMTSFSIIPLQLASVFGIILCFITIASALHFMRNGIVSRSVMIPPWLFKTGLIFCFGVQFICIGILGEYLARILAEAKQRPLYVIRSIEGIADNTHA